MALRGMPSYLAVAGSWTMVIPPAALTARRAAVPSLPEPESTTQIECSFWLFGKRPEEKIDGHAQSTGLDGGSEPEGPVSDRHEPVRGNDVDVVGIDPHPVLCLNDLHPGRTGD